MKKGRVLLAAALILLVAVVAFPSQSVNVAKNAFLLWIQAVVPALLPFFIGASLLDKSGAADFLAVLFSGFTRRVFHCSGYASYAFILSMLSGYPMGAKLISQFVHEGKMERAEAARAAAFCSTSGPLFMIGTLGAAMLGNVQAGIIIAVSHYAGAFLNGIIFNLGCKAPEKSDKRKALVRAIEVYRSRASSSPAFGTALSESIRDGMSAMFLICGTIMVFAVLAEALRASGGLQLFSRIFPGIPDGLAQASLWGVVEMATGSRILADLSTSMPVIIGVMSFIVSFGGLSVHAQTLAFLSGAGISSKKYVAAKFLHGVFAALISSVLCSIFPAGNTPVFNMDSVKMNNEWSIYPGLIFLVVIILASLLSIYKKQKSAKS